MERILNFREVKLNKLNKDGLKLKEGLIYRSALPSMASAKDIETMLSNNINYIYDLRSVNEINETPSLEVFGIKNKNISIIQNAKQNTLEDINKIEMEDLFSFMVQLYKEEFIESEGFSLLFNSIVMQDSNQFLVHCTAGKDRTGIAVAIMLLILDFEYKDVKVEYLILDNKLVSSMESEIRKKIKNEDIRHDISDLLGIKAEYIDAFYNETILKYGSFNNYVKDKLSLSELEINELKERYLEN